LTGPSANQSLRLPKIPRVVWVLGFVSLMMDVSSEIVHSLLPVFLTTTIGVSVSFVGLIDGIAESTTSIVKIFSGYLSDRIRRRKPFLLLGYGLAAFSKPFFPLAHGVTLVLGARFADRIGKGLRGAPRDALIADVTPSDIRGRAYGLRQSLDTTGAFFGPLLAIALMVLFTGDMRAVFWVATVPAGLAVLLIIFGVKDRARKIDAADAPPPIRIAEIAGLSRRYWGVVILGVMFSLARFSEAFLILKVSADGLPMVLVPLVLVVMNIVYALGAYPAGVLSDSRGPARLLLSGLGMLIAADLILAFSSSIAGSFAGIALWGIHMALTQGLFAKLVAENVPGSLRGSAFGLFNLLTGMALLVASVLAGLAWDYFSPAATFLIGAGFATAGGVVTLLSNLDE